MKAYKDLEGKIPCQDGDRVARAVTELPEHLANTSMAENFVPWVFIQPDENKRPVYRDIHSPNVRDHRCSTEASATNTERTK
jgi:hypothetical protein